MKKILIALGILILIILIFMGGFHVLARAIFKSNSCTHFNIDNIELRTGINIPAVIDWECENTNNTKNAVFTIDSNKVNVQEYLTRNNFTQTDGNYIKSGESKKTIWDAYFSTQTNQLSIDITYKDKRK